MGELEEDADDFDDAPLFSPILSIAPEIYPEAAVSAPNRQLKKAPATGAALQRLLLNKLLEFVRFKKGPSESFRDLHSISLNENEDPEPRIKQLRDDAHSLVAERLLMFQKASEAFQSLGRNSGGASVASFYARKVRSGS